MLDNDRRSPLAEVPRRRGPGRPTAGHGPIADGHAGSPVQGVIAPSRGRLPGIVTVEAGTDLADGAVEAAGRETMVSYAQNAEDVVLERAFADTVEGFYVDIGASTPVDDSVTYHFYGRGWHGVNVEPDPDDFERLVASRARDVNLHAAVGGGKGRLDFYPSAVRGHGTVDPARAAAKGEIARIKVEQVSLAQVFADHAPPEGVDFLKIDVEGWEADVIASGDWQRHRPRVVVVEAVDGDGRPTHEAWEQTLLGANYRLVLFDGLNRFYCSNEDTEALAANLGSPANVLDNWRPVREIILQAALQERLVEIEAQGAAERARLDREREKAREEAQQAHEEAQQAHEEAQQAQQAHKEAHQAHEEAQQALEQRRQELAAVYASTSWRITSTVRDASRLAKLLRRGRAA
jgi:FkbM family methyltransferase